MNLKNRMKLFSAIGGLLLPQVVLAANSTSDGSATNYNLTLITLVCIIIFLLFVIGMLGGTLRMLSFAISEKNQKERAGKSGIVKAVLFLLCLLPSVWASAQQGGGEVAQAAPKFISGIPEWDFYLIIGFIFLELVVIFSLSLLVHSLIRTIRANPELEMKEKAKAVISKSWFWDKFNSATSIEKEKDIMLDHDYDGIRELDNSLPPWWIYGFYLTIIVAIVYIYRFHISHDGMSQREEYVAEMEKGEADKAEYLAKSANNVDENTVVILASAGDIASGQELFIKNCAACHLADGGGTVGPNLTDEYWLHGGSIKDIFKSIKYGWQDKGMKSWKDDLSPKQIQEVASFIKTLKGTHPLTPKAPQGDIYIEATEGAPSDSTKSVVDSVKATAMVAGKQI